MGEDKIEIRKLCCPKDLERMAELFATVFSKPPYNEAWTRETAVLRLQENYRRFGQEYQWFAEHEGKVIGMISCTTKTWHDGVHVQGEEIAVHSEYRAQGVGKKLVDKVLQIARREGAVSFDGEVYIKSEAYHFWKKRGAKESGFRHFSIDL